MTADGYRLGIGFGTATTVAVLAGPDGRVRPLLFDASPLLASAVFAGPGPEVLTGVDAERAAIAQPAGLEANPKRRIDDGTVWLGEREVPVVDLVAAVLGRVVTEARRVAGDLPGSVTLTHPAVWSRTRLGILTGAAARAGLGQVGLVAEPIAAATYFATVLGADLPTGRCLVVYDLGAGTFDVSIVRRSATGFEVIATDGLADVGGLDLDAAVVDHARSLTVGAAEAWGRLDWPQTPEDQQARHSLWRGARAAKEQLSRHATADLHVSLVAADLHLTREEFDKAARPHLDRTVALTLSTLRTAGVPPEKLAGVFLVGGASRTPLAATLLHRTLRIAPTAIDHPELVVAEGSLHTTPAPGPAAPSAAVPPAPVPPPVTQWPAGPPLARTPAATTPLAPPPAAASPFVPPPAAASPFVPAPLVLSEVVAPGPGPVLAPPPAVPSVRTLADHDNTVRGVAFSPDGRLLATASDDETVRLWNISATHGTAV